MKEESFRGLMVLKPFIRRLQRGLLLSASRGSSLNAIKLDQETKAAKIVPNDVKQGHFAINAMKGGEPTRFIVELDYLNDPDFMNLLEQAEEEYGFQQKGVLAVPCRPQELQMILGNRRKRMVVYT